MKRWDCSVCQLLLCVFKMEIIMRCHVLCDCVCVGVPFSPQIDCIDFILRIRNHHGATAAHPLQSLLVLSTYVYLSVPPFLSLVHMCLRVRLCIAYLCVICFQCGFQRYFTHSYTQGEGNTQIIYKNNSLFRPCILDKYYL